MRIARNGVAFALVFVALVSIPLEQRASSGSPHVDLIVIGVAALLGVAAAVVYTLRESNVERAERVRTAAWVAIRYFLAFELTRYGMAKVVGMQFYRRFYLLDSRVVDLKPMHLAWSFFGQSYAYQAVTGAIEIASALLLCFRRTTTLGACVLLAVMSNVVLVNYWFDVSVKLFSTIYLVMIGYVLAMEAKRFWAFFISDAPVPPRRYLASASASASASLAHRACVALVIGIAAADIVHEAVKHRLFTDEPLLGAWDVSKREGLDELAPEAKQPWSKVYFEKGDYGFVRVGQARTRFTFAVDEANRTLRVTSAAGASAPVFEGALDREARSARFTGTHDGHPFALELTRDLPR
jgi:hypothetical protein